LELYIALKTFFFKLYPEYSKLPFYIAGESYAGKYVPYLASTVLTQNKQSAQKINLQGIAIGDGYTNPYYQVRLYSLLQLSQRALTLGPLEAGAYASFLYFRGLISGLTVDATYPLYLSFQALVDAGDYSAAATVDNALLNTLVMAAGNVDVYGP